MIISILTIFPDMIRTIFEYGVIGQAIKKGLLEIKPIDLRNFTSDKHRSVDGKPFGGGPGMVGRVDVIDAALQATNYKLQTTSQRIILLSPQGKLFNQAKAQEYNKLDHLILISGRYEGVDERVAQNLVDEELSIGDYVLSGGEIPAMVVADAIARLIPGVVGKSESLLSESFSDYQPFSHLTIQPSCLDYPVYTEPKEYQGWKVPEILFSGHHENIKKWRAEQAQFKTKRQRPDFS